MNWKGRTCSNCGIVLTENNVSLYKARTRHYECKKCSRLHEREKKRRLRRKVLEVLGGECTKCGFKDWRALQIDHIKGDGFKERDRGRHIGHNQSRYYAILKMSEEERRSKFQCLCANCNWIKVYENEEFRHKTI